MKEVGILVFLLVILSLATVWDYKSGKIPNYLVIAGIGLGIVNILINENITVIFKYIPGIIFPILLFYPVYKIGGIGAGDLKLLSMLGFYFSFMEMTFCIFISIFLGALLSLIKMAYYHNFWERLEYLFSYLRGIIFSGKIRYYDSTEGKEVLKKTKVHLACPILLGVLVTGGIF